jgi:predicted phosphohydrolase
MARLFALADLHLSGTGDKPMDVFGEVWAEHSRRMAEAWDERVAPEDFVLLPGDISWARNLSEARPDLEWIAGRPGRKLLLRGNHDSWWGSAARVREALPPGCDLLQNDSHLLGDRVVVGARGWTSPDDPHADANADRIFRRELERLRLSILHADRTFGRDRPRVAMLHFPPWVDGYEPTPVVALLRRGGVRVVVYGHLHGEDHALAVRGERDGLYFCFVAADAVDFAPTEIPLDPEVAELAP